MGQHLQKELEELKESLTALSGLVEDSVQKAVLALRNLDVELAEKVIEADHYVDLREVEVEEECLKILALHQPVAVDLRFVIATLKINNDLERVGDLSVNIAERTKYLSQKAPVEIPFDFDTMAGKTRSMLKKALESMVKMDAKMAEEVCHEDQEVDEINRLMYKQVYREVKKRPDHVKQLIHYLSVSRHLERIADYATNIAEDVIYMIEGTIVRHHPEDYMWDKED